MKLENILKKSARIIKKGFVYPAMISSSIFFGCEKDIQEGPAPVIPQDTTSSKDIYLYDNVYSLKASQIISMDDSGTIKYSSPVSVLPGDIVAPDGICSTNPDGFLCRVISVSDDKTEIKTSPVTLDKVIKQGSINSEKTFKPSDIQSQNSLKGSSLKSVKGSLYDFNQDFNNVVIFDLDKNLSTTYDQIVLNGGIYFNVSSKFNFDFDNGKIDSKFELIVTGNSDLKFESKIDSLTFNKEIKLWSAKFNPYVITLTPIPIIVRPNLEIYAGADGVINSKMQLGASDDLTADAGIAYSNGVWTPIKDFSNKFNYENLTVDFNSDVKIYTGSRITLSIDGILGPYADLKGSLKFNADSKLNPWWNLYGRFETKVGIKMNQLISNLIPDYETELANDSVLIANAKGSFPLANTPPDAIINVTPSSSGTTSTDFVFSASSSFDKEDKSSLQYRWDWESDGVWDVSYSINPLQNHKFSQEGLYTVKLEVKDAGGLTDSATVNINVKNNQPQESTLKDSRDGKTYKTIVVGDKTWMTQNLDYKSDNSRCYENNSTNCNEYGALYTWTESNSVCPSGWHLPSVNEWNQLTKDLGFFPSEFGYIESTSGEVSKLLEGGSSKLNFQLGGFYWNNASSYVSIDQKGCYRISTRGDYAGLSVEFTKGSGTIKSVDGFDSDGLSVRCVKDGK